MGTILYPQLPASSRSWRAWILLASAALLFWDGAQLAAAQAPPPAQPKPAAAALAHPASHARRRAA
ncbi:MAG: hypothetical protein WCE75_14450, partial [Terracidiphilus sp.]